MQQLIIMGAGGFAREVYCWVEVPYAVFFDNTRNAKDYLLGRPVFHALTNMQGSSFTIAVGNPQLKKDFLEIADKAGMLLSGYVLHHDITRAFQTHIEPGAIICPGVRICPDVKIGKCVIMNLNSTIGHDSVIGDFSTVAPGALISGNVTIGKSVQIGTGACIREGVKIGEGAIIGMGAVVTKDVGAFETHWGNPARKMR